MGSFDVHFQIVLLRKSVVTKFTNMRSLSKMARKKSNSIKDFKLKPFFFSSYFCM